MKLEKEIAVIENALPELLDPCTSPLADLLRRKQAKLAGLKAMRTTAETKRKRKIEEEEQEVEQKEEPDNTSSMSDVKKNEVWRRIRETLAVEQYRSHLYTSHVQTIHSMHVELLCMYTDLAKEKPTTTALFSSVEDEVSTTLSFMEQFVELSEIEALVSKTVERMQFALIEEVDEDKS